MAATTSQKILLCVAGAWTACAVCTAIGCGQAPVVRKDEPAQKPAAPAAPPEGRYGTTIHRPYAQLGIVTPADDGRGKPARVPCMTCHNNVKAKERNRGARLLKDFHQEVRLKHGNHTCQTCHTTRPEGANTVSGTLSIDPSSRPSRGSPDSEGPDTVLAPGGRSGFDTFHLADGTIVPYENVMTLCGQCHATRLQEYQKGAHGGMSGYWDLRRGPRVRNHCLDCHNAHAPAIPKVVPAPRQRYRKGL